jgi:hypothetical protein
MQQILEVENLSHNKTISIGFTPPTIAHEPKHLKQILPSQKVRIAVGNGGTMNLFVFEDNKKIWEGIVPINIRKPLSIDPEKKDVHYLNLSLPSGFSPLTKSHFSHHKQSKWMWLMLLILPVIGILVAIWFIFIFGRKNKNKYIRLDK